MPDQHPNIEIMSRLDLRDLDACAQLFANDFVWHYFNPNLPEVEGDYFGIDGLKAFFGKISAKTNGTFRVEPVSIQPIGDELVVTHVRDGLEFEGKPIAIDVVVVWRIVEGQIAEAWDIPSAFTTSASEGRSAA